jgi:hypothetical protein
MTNNDVVYIYIYSAISKQSGEHVEGQYLVYKNKAYIITDTDNLTPVQVEPASVGLIPDRRIATEVANATATGRINFKSQKSNSNFQGGDET